MFIGLLWFVVFGARSHIGHLYGGEPLVPRKEAGRQVNHFSTSRSLSPLPVVKCDQLKGQNASDKIRACIAALPEVGGTADARDLRGAQRLFGSIVVDKPAVLLLGRTTYTHSGEGPIFRLATGAKLECISPSATLVTTVMEIDGVSPASKTAVKNCTLRGNNVAARGYSGIDSGDAADVVIEGNIIEHWGEAGLNTGGSSTNWSIRGNIFRQNAAQGVFVAGGSNHNVVSNNEARDNGSQGIDVNGSWNTISDNVVYNNGAAHHAVDCWGILIASVMGYDANYNTIVGNTVDRTNCQGIILKPSGNGSVSYNVVTRNTVSRSRAENGDGIAIDGSSTGLLRGNTISGNVVQTVARYSILLDGSAAALEENLVTNNRVQGGDAGVVILGSKLKNNTILANSLLKPDSRQRTR
jgi:parallel beta-helix repeat protein